jgi:hypothetical protein
MNKLSHWNKSIGEAPWELLAFTNLLHSSIPRKRILIEHFLIVLLEGSIGMEAKVSFYITLRRSSMTKKNIIAMEKSHMT